jgi:NB-ARC domain
VRLEPRPADVVGQESFLEDLRRRFNASPGITTVALRGLGGVGKSTIAAEYAHRHINEYDLIWTLRCEDAAGLSAQLHELAKALDVDDLLDRTDPVVRVHSALAGFGRWLLIFDNARDAENTRSWLPTKGRGHVLVTTQDGHWPDEQAIEVGVLSIKEATALLMNGPIRFDQDSAEAVALELGLLPLALAQAVGYMETTGRTMTEYLDLLRSNHARLMSRGSSGVGTSIVATWSVEVDDLARTSPSSISLLRLLACLAPEDIPVRLLFRNWASMPDGLMPSVGAEVEALRRDELSLDDAIAGLRRYSLISPPNDMVTVHRLTQAVALDNLPPTARDA